MRLRASLLGLSLLGLACLPPACTIYDTSLLLDGEGGSGGVGGEGGEAGEAGEGGGGQAGTDGGAAGDGGGEGGDAGTGGVGGEGGSAGQGGAAGGAGCLGASDCDDQNPCTVDTCTDGACANTADDALKPPQVTGDCHAEVCQGGQARSLVDEADKPVDEGNPCTLERCDQDTPTKDLLDGEACQLGDKTGVCKAGVCQVECSAPADCDDGNPCTTNECTANKCSFTPLSDSTPTPGASDMAGDCKKSVCLGGVAASVADASDLPAGDACKTPICTGTEPGTNNKPNGTDCGGGSICLAGVCKASSCGDGFIGPGEECEGQDFAGKTCATQVPGSVGDLACNGSCKISTSGCTVPVKCGDGKVDAGEECDDTTTPAAPGGGCSAYCKNEPAVGDLVITEIMYNPQAAPTNGSIELGEWFEVYNTSTKAYDVRGLQLTSKTSGELVIIGEGLATPLVIPAKSYVVMTRGKDETETTLFKPFYVYGSKISFSNSSEDYVRLDIATTPSLTLLDVVTYSPSSSYTGKSYSLNPTALAGPSPHLANDSSANFCGASTDFGVTGAGGSSGVKDKGTPGAANDACP